MFNSSVIPLNYDEKVFLKLQGTFFVVFFHKDNLETALL